MTLDADDLAYMRQVQDEHRPTDANLVRRTDASDGMGGHTETESDPVPVTVRVAQTDKVPEALADRYGVGVVTVTMDRATTTSGDLVKVSPTEVYEVVSDGALGVWATAQRVYAVRTVWPQGGA